MGKLRVVGSMTLLEEEGGEEGEEEGGEEGEEVMSSRTRSGTLRVGARGGSVTISVVDASDVPTNMSSSVEVEFKLGTKEAHQQQGSGTTATYSFPSVIDEDLVAWLQSGHVTLSVYGWTNDDLETFVLVMINIVQVHHDKKS